MAKKKKQSTMKFTAMNAPTDFSLYRNLLFYPDAPEGLFFFNSLTFERNEQYGGSNDEYMNKSWHIATEGHNYLTNNNLTNSEGLLTRGSDAYNQKLQYIITFLETAIKTEQQNELTYFKNMIQKLQHDFPDPDTRPENIQNLINFFLAAQSTGIIDYDNYIININNLLQGEKNTKSLIEYENQRLADIERRTQDVTHILAESQVGGTANFSQLSKRAQNILLYQNEQQLKARYMKTGRISPETSVTQLDKLVASIMSGVMQGADYKIATICNNMAQEILQKPVIRQKILEQINKYYSNKQTNDLQSLIRNEIILGVQAWGSQHMDQLLNNLSTTHEGAKVEAELINNLTNLQGLYSFEIENLPNFFNFTGALAFFNKFTKGKKRSGEGLYDAVSRFEKQIKQAQQDKRRLTKDEKKVIQALGLNTNNQQLVQQIDLLQNLEAEILEKAKEVQEENVTLQFEEIGKILQLTNTTNISGTITVTVSKDGTISFNKDNTAEMKQLAKILSDNNYINTRTITSSNLQNFIRTMKSRASSIFRTTLENQIKRKARTNLLEILNKHLVNVKVNVKGYTRNELTAGLELAQKNNGELVLHFGGPQNNKNDFVVITLNPGVEQLKKDFLMSYDNSVKDSFNKAFQPLLKDKAEAINRFQRNFVQDMQDMKNKSNQYHNYKKKAQSFFQRYQEQQRLLQRSIKKYEKSRQSLQQLRHLMKNLQQYNKQQMKQIDKKIEKIKHQLLNSIYRSDTMKTYNEYQNKIGFVGGAIGTNLAQQLNSINMLFDEAGIKFEKNDLQLLHDLIINTSYHSIIGNKYVGVLERYMSAIAAFALFDEGGAEIELLKEQITKSKQHALSPKILHMYKLDSIYYPGSFILKETLKGIKSLGKVMTINTHGARIKITNSIIQNDIPNHKWQPGQAINPKPWETVSDLADEKVQLQITFMAGMTQIISNLEKRMNTIVIP